MHTHLYQSYSHANNILDNTGNYKRKIPKTFCMYIYLDGQLIHQKRMHFFMTKEQSFVLPNSDLIYNHSYISPFVTEFSDGSVWTKHWS